MRRWTISQDPLTTPKNNEGTITTSDVKGRTYLNIQDNFDILMFGGNIDGKGFGEMVKYVRNLIIY